MIVDGHPIQRMVEAIDPPVLRDPYHGLQPLVLEGVTSYAISPPAKLGACIHTAWGRSWRFAGGHLPTLFAMRAEKPRSTR